IPLALAVAKQRKKRHPAPAFQAAPRASRAEAAPTTPRRTRAGPKNRRWVRSGFPPPIVFYPLVGVIAALVIAVSAKPLSWPREAREVAGERAGSAIVLKEAAFAAPAPDPQ